MRNETIESALLYQYSKSQALHILVWSHATYMTLCIILHHAEDYLHKAANFRYLYVIKNVIIVQLILHLHLIKVQLPQAPLKMHSFTCDR